MKKCLFTLIAISLMAGASCQQKTNSDEEIKALAEKYLKVMNGGDLSLFDEILSPQYVLHLADGTETIGIDAMKEEITSLRTMFPDVNMTFDELIIEGDKVVTRWTVTGTNTGPMGGLPPTGKEIKFSGVNIGNIVDGKVREEWEFYNQAMMYVQLGFAITPPAE